jgi:prevent-host-death family protein
MRIASHGRPVVVTKSGRDAVVMVDVETWKHWDAGARLAAAIDAMWGKSHGDRVRAALLHRRGRSSK